jgi:hypothetical protein
LSPQGIDGLIGQDGLARCTLITTPELNCSPSRTDVGTDGLALPKGVAFAFLVREKGAILRLSASPVLAHDNLKTTFRLKSLSHKVFNVL